MGGWHFVWAVSIMAALVVACSETNETYPPPAALCKPGLSPMTSPVRGPCSPLVSGPVCLDDHQLVACFQGAEGRCYQPTQQCAPGTCLPPGGRYTADHCADCEELRTEYTHVLASAYRAVAKPESMGIAPGTYNYAEQCEPDDCQTTTTTTADCHLGLGACWYLGKPIPRLDELARAYESLDCPGAVTCDCPAQVVNASCETNPEGYRVWGTDQRFTHACVVK